MTRQESANVIPLPRRLDVRKPPRRLARKPKAPVVHLRPAPTDKERAYSLYCQASKLDERDPGEGERLYREALRLDPGLGLAWTNLGNLHYRERRFDEARRCYERALAVDPDQPEALHNMGHMALDDGWFREAIVWLSRVTERDPSFADAWYNLGMAYRKVYDNRNAARAFSRYLELEPASEWASRARNYHAYHTGESRAHLRVVK